jgi:hypothetical protein
MPRGALRAQVRIATDVVPAFLIDRATVRGYTPLYVIRYRVVKTR